MVLLAFALLAASGCGNSNGNGDAAGADMTVLPDLTVVPSPDLTTLADMTSPTTCAAALACVLPCTTPQCVGGCGSGLTGASRMKWAELGACSNAMCFPVDGGTGDCTSVTDRSAACLNCANTRCAAEWQACMADH
jgi:hypothetical protein